MIRRLLSRLADRIAPVVPEDHPWTRLSPLDVAHRYGYDAYITDRNF